MKTSHPRLLIATEFGPNAPGGGPAIVRQMLRGWPTEMLSWWSCSSGGESARPLAPSQVFSKPIPARLYPHRRATRSKAFVLEQFWVPRAAKHLRTTLAAARPEAVWSIPHRWAIPVLSMVLPEAPVRFHISIHDYPDAHHPEQSLGRAIAARQVAGVLTLYREAISRDVISAEMASDMKRRTEISADQILHAGVEPEEMAYLARKQGGQSETIKVAYAGTIVAPETFQAVVASLARIRRSLPRPLELHLFGAHSYRSAGWFDHSWMREHGNLPAADLHRQLRECDWGFAPMELTDVNPQYNHYSLPTKVVSYLATGLPIIAAGHSASTISRLSARFSLGLRMDENSIAGMEEALLDGLSEADPWESHGPEIIRCAQAEFDAESMRRQLHVRFKMTA